MRTVIGLGIIVSLAAIVLGQGVNPAMLLKPPVDSWPTYHGDYTGKHHSSFTQITPANLKDLKQAWKFQTTSGVKSTPVLVNGVIYISAPDNVWAVDARTGKELWRYTQPRSDAF